MAEYLNSLPLTELRKRKSTKWRSFPKDVLPLPVAEMDFPIADLIKKALQDMIDRSDTGYLGAFPEMLEAFKSISETLWSWTPDVTQMRTSTDVGVGVVEVLRTLISPGDAIVLNSPIYDNMWRWINEVKGKLVDVPLINEGMNYQMDLAGVETAYKAGAKVHLLCSPHNPVGIVFSKETLSNIADLAEKYGVIIISDEIHAPLTFDSKEFTPFLNVSTAAQRVGITVTSASKTFNLAGLKCALIITQDEKLKERINSMPVSVAFRASLFGAVAATAAMSESQEWLDNLIYTLDQNRKLLRNLIDSKAPAIGYREPDFGYLAWLDLSQLGLGDDPAKQILERSKLAVNAGSMYGPNSKHHIRFNFGTGSEIITEAFDRIMQSI
jgi:cysteine-S-conjugate beta-lyase